MATQLQIRRGTTAQMGAFTGAEGELAVNTSTDTVHVHDGATAGGFALAKADGSNIGTYAGSFTTISASGAITGNVTGNLTGSILTAAQTNITSVGTLSTLAVSGTVTMDGLTVETTNGLNAVLESANSYQYLQFKNTQETNNYLGFVGNAFSVTAANKKYLQVDGNGDISFYEDTGTTPKLFWDASAESLGIGTAAPEKAIHVKTAVNNTAFVKIESTAADSYPTLALKNDAREYQLTAHGPLGDKFTIYDGTAGSHRFVIDSAGNVGIGTSSPSYKADILATNQLALRLNTTDADGCFLAIQTNGTAKGYLGTSHHLATGTPSENDITLRAENNLQFTTGGGSERLRIDSAGNLLVGQSSTTLPGVGNTTAGVSIRGTDGSFFSRALGSGDTNNVVSINRSTASGNILGFQQGGTTVGSIGTINSAVYIGTLSENSGITFQGTALQPTNGAQNRVDNTNDIGSGTYRWDDIYATNGTIQTSDRNEKQDIEALSDAEQRVALAAKGLLRKFRWKDSVAEKGDEARTHFGIIAQDLQAAFEAEGLDAGDYAMFISTTWTDEETGEERSRMGVRYSELLAFIIAAI